MPRNSHILIKNIYWMLCYAFRVWKHPVLQSIDTEEFDDIDDLFAAILSKGVARQLKQGLYREYDERCDNLSTLRGKVDMQGTIRHKINHRQILSCEYDDLSENNLYNRILKTAMRMLLRSDKVEERYKVSLRKNLLYFSDVDFVDPNTVPWSKVRIHRNNRFYCLLIGICRLVLEGSVMSPDSGDRKLIAFDENRALHAVYEDFVREYYRREYPELSVSAEYIPWATASEDDVSLLPQMKTDTTLRYGDNVLIIDTKFYEKVLTDWHGVEIRSVNLYQIFAYVKNMAAKPEHKDYTVSGMLLYARTDEDVYPDECYNMSSNKIVVKTLDLNRDFAEIKSDLNDIAEEFFGLERPVAVSL